MKSLPEFNNMAPMLSSEAILLAQTDPLGKISSRFNPSVIRVFKDFKNRPINSNALRSIFGSTEKILHALNKGAHKFPDGSMVSIYRQFLLARHEDNREASARNCAKLVATCSSEREYQILAACMAILQPASDTVWREYDIAMKKALDTDQCSIDTGLLASLAITNACKDKFFKQKPQTPKALLQLITRVKTTIHSKQKSNVFNYAQYPPKLVNESTMETSATVPPNELFTSIGVNTVRDSPELERLGLVLHLFSSVHSARKEHQGILRDLTDYGVKLLTMQQNPVKLNTLKVLWLNAPDASMVSAYAFYKTLYEQVLYSIACEPLQIIHEELSITVLLESMVRSKFKSSLLVNKLHEIISQQGMSYRKFGMEMFGYLIELDSIPFAMNVLDYYLSGQAVGQDIRTSRLNSDGNRRDIVLPEKAKQHLLGKLATQTSFQYGDLAILLLNVGGAESVRVHQQLLHRVEVALLSTIPTLSINKASTLLRLYGSAGRKYPPMIKALNKVIAEKAATAQLAPLTMAMWASARLNDREAEFIPIVTSMYFDSIQSISTLNSQGVSTMCSMLWSLSVLERLELSQFERCRQLLEKYMTSRGGQTLHSWADVQLQQVWCEAQILRQKEGKTAPLKSSAEAKSTEHLATLPWYRTQVPMTEDPESSQTHLDASKLLNRMGITHQNEVQLANGYVVDTFIPVSAMPKPKPFSGVPSWLRATVSKPVGSSDSSEDITPEGEQLVEETEIEKEVASPQCEGFVLEFDGPTHFESYMHVSYSILYSTD